MVGSNLATFKWFLKLQRVVSLTIDKVLENLTLEAGTKLKLMMMTSSVGNLISLVVWLPTMCHVELELLKNLEMLVVVLL